MGDKIRACVKLHNKKKEREKKDGISNGTQNQMKDESDDRIRHIGIRNFVKGER